MIKIKKKQLGKGSEFYLYFNRHNVSSDKKEEEETSFDTFLQDLINISNCHNWCWRKAATSAASHSA